MKEKELHFICDAIRKFRYQKSMSQQQVANQLKISQNAYYKIENGHTKLTVLTLLCLVDVFGVPLRDFFAGIE